MKTVQANQGPIDVLLIGDSITIQWAEAWEKHILPARLSPYSTAWLDSLMQTSDLMWFGCGSRKISFAFSEDLELFIEQDSRDRRIELPEEKALYDEIERLFPEKIGKYSFFDIVRYSKLDSRTVTEKLWKLAWRGLVANDSFATLRKGIMTKFAPFTMKKEEGRPSRSAYNRWAASRPLSGAWYVIMGSALERERLPPAPPDNFPAGKFQPGQSDVKHAPMSMVDESDAIDEAELAKDRVRQLFKRYGIIFRELLANEPPVLQWAKIFKALRLMELSGEIISGHFFEGIPGLQFMSHEAFRFLNQPLPEESIYWINATDPASLCGIKLESLKGRLPSRIPSIHLVFHGRRLVVISRKNGRALEYLVPSDDPHIPDYLSFQKVLLTREFSPERNITI